MTINRGAPAARPQYRSNATGRVGVANARPTRAGEATCDVCLRWRSVRTYWRFDPARRRTAPPVAGLLVCRGCDDEALAEAGVVQSLGAARVA